LFFEKINKIDKSLANLTKQKRGKTQINKLRNEKEEITTNTKKIQGIIRNYFKNQYSNKLENLQKIDKFLNTHDHPRLNQGDINHLSSSITHNETEAAIKNLPKKKKKTKVQDLMDSPLNSTRSLKKN
jgi:hypothetical protein